MTSLVHTLALEAFGRDLQSIAPRTPAGLRPTLSEALCKDADVPQVALTLTLPADLVALLDILSVKLQSDDPDHVIGPADAAAALLIGLVTGTLPPTREA